MRRLSLDSRFARVNPFLVGVWRFRRYGKPEGWCCTYTINGNYHDTFPSKSMEIALDKVHKNVKRSEVVE